MIIIKNNHIILGIKLGIVIFDIENLIAKSPTEDVVLLHILNNGKLLFATLPGNCISESISLFIWDIDLLLMGYLDNFTYY